MTVAVLLKHANCIHFAAHDAFNGAIPSLGADTASVAKLPTNPIGVATLTLTNLVVGSAVQLEVASTGAVVANTSAAATSLTLSAPVYQAGSAGNNLRIKVRKGTATPYYQPYETLLTVAVGATSIYISQLLDE